MVVYGYAKAHKYAGDGTLQIQVRIPSMHGPYTQSEYKGQAIRNYTQDADLPYYPALLLPHIPKDGDVVAVASLDAGNRNFLVLGVTGGSYSSGLTNL